MTKLSDLTPDHSNANKGTERGAVQLDESLTRYGAGRSVLVDKRGVVIAGNKTVQEAVNKGFPARVVHTDGKELIVVQRTDLDLDNDKGGRARQLAYADNRVAEIDLEWDIKQIGADLDAGVDLGTFWREDELKELTGRIDGVDMPELGSGDKGAYQQMTFTLHDEQAESVKAALIKAKDAGVFDKELNENSNGNALERIAEAYLGQG